MSPDWISIEDAEHYGTLCNSKVNYGENIMIKGIGHLGLFVNDIESSLTALAKFVEFEEPVIKESKEMGVKAAVISVGSVGLELIQDATGQGPLAQLIKEKGDSIHHFCLLSDNIEADIALLKNRGVEMMDQKPRIGMRGKKIAMTMPSALNGITIELSEP
jgi:methylmalonyl-CoA/ethylmalonyl-CoA epimerase